MDNYIKCQKCGSCIDVNTDSLLIWCACGAIGVDGNEYYTRILGDRESWKAYENGKEVQ